MNAFTWVGTPEELLDQLDRHVYGGWRIIRDQTWETTYNEYEAHDNYTKKEKIKTHRNQTGSSYLHYKHGGGFVGNNPIALLGWDGDKIVSIHPTSQSKQVDIDILLYLLKKKVTVTDE